MTPTSEQSIQPTNDKFQQAEQMIDNAIAGMDNKTHIEYGSTMERKSSPSMWQKILHRLRFKHD